MAPKAGAPGHTCPRFGWPHTPHRYMRRRGTGVNTEPLSAGTTGLLATRRCTAEDRHVEAVRGGMRGEGDAKYPSWFCRSISEVCGFSGDAAAGEH